MRDPNNPCLFCDSKKSGIARENDLAYASYDSYPVSDHHCLIIPNTDLKKRSTPIISILKFLTELIDLLPAIVIDILQDKKNYMTTLILFMTLECRIAGLPNF